MNERQARMSNTCPGCGKNKPAGPDCQIVCWDCWKDEKNPLKYFSGTFEEWLDSIKLLKKINEFPH